MYSSCSLYNVRSKKHLFRILSIDNKKWLKQQYIQENILPYIEKSKKQRLIEAPQYQLKMIQRRIKNCLMKCEFPEYVFSGVKNKSYIDNAKYHIGAKYLYKIDISAFFPNIPREKVYYFFKYKMKNCSDVAQALTNLCTCNLNKYSHNIEIDNFINIKNIRQLNHLITGSPCSPILSYLVNEDMFNEIKNISQYKDIRVTIYVDDVIFSSMKPISKSFRKRIIKIISKNGYNVSKTKIKYYDNCDIKLVTGVIINKDGSLDVPNKLRYKIIKKFKDIDKNNNNNIEKKSIYGCINSARRIDKNAFSTIMYYVKQ